MAPFGLDVVPDVYSSWTRSVSDTVTSSSGTVPLPGPVHERVVGVAQQDHRVEPVLDLVEAARQGGVAQRHPAAGLVHEVGQLRAGQRVVDRHVHQPGPGAAEKPEQVGVGIPAVGRHPVAFGQPETEQDAGRAGHGFVEFAVGPGALGKAQRPAFGMPAGAAAYDVVDRAGPHHGDLRRGVAVPHYATPRASGTQHSRVSPRCRRQEPGHWPIAAGAIAGESVVPQRLSRQELSDPAARFGV